MAPAILSIRTLTRRVRRSKCAAAASPKNARMEASGAEDAEHSRVYEGEGEEHESDFVISDEEDAILESDDAEVVIESCPSSNTSSSSSSIRQHAANLVLLQYPSSSSSSHASSTNRLDVVEPTNDTDAARPPDTALPAVRIETPLLFPVLMTPQQVPRATEIQLFLNRIEYIEINDVIEREDNVIYYILDIYRYRQQNGIPTRRRAHTATAMTATSPQSSALTAPVLTAPVLTAPQQKQPQLNKSDSFALRVPDYQIEHRYSSFARLRTNVWQIARKRHRRGRSCSYCGSLINFFLQTDAQPSMKVKFTTTTDARKAILSKFINDLLLATRNNHVDCARSMRGYHQIPMLMKRFLNEQTGETFFS
ncbi:hypothetical protein FI667_g3498, partial [Globisporangium splendens]